MGGELRWGVRDNQSLLQYGRGSFLPFQVIGNVYIMFITVIPPHTLAEGSKKKARFKAKKGNKLTVSTRPNSPYCRTSSYHIVAARSPGKRSRSLGYSGRGRKGFPRCVGDGR